MRASRLLLLCQSVLLAVFASFCLPSAAQAGDVFNPYEPVGYILPFSPGGESDLVAKAQQPLLERELKAAVDIRYLPGSGGVLASRSAARALKSDNKMYFFIVPHMLVQPILRRFAGYESSDIQPVMIFSSTSLALVVPKDSPYKDFASFLEGARNGKVVIGGSSTESANHLGTLRLGKLLGVNFKYEPASGTFAAVDMLLKGKVQALMTYTDVSVRDGDKVRTLAVASDERMVGIDAPTFRELGYDFVETAYQGVAVSSEKPAAEVQKLYESFAAVNKNPEFAEKMRNMGFLLEDMNPVACREFWDKMSADYKKQLGTN